MGLFSFLKNAGSKIFGNREEEASVSAEELKSQREDALRSVIKSLNLPIDSLSVEVDDDKVTVFGETSSQADKEKAVLALGNIEGVATVDDRISLVAPPATFYEVKSGDSLSKIAKEHYGDPMKYMAIFEANQPMLKDPNEIYPGQVLRIPPLG